LRARDALSRPSKPVRPAFDILYEEAHMKRRLFTGTIAAAVLALTAFAGADDFRGRNDFAARLIGPEETPLSISTAGHGRLALHINSRSEAIEYELSYEGLEGVQPTTPNGVVLFSHIHFGQRRTSGGVSAFLCGGGSKGACPTPSGTVRGTIVAGDIVGLSGQGIDAGQFEELVSAIRTGYAYANVHTTKYMSGEIRGQIRSAGDDDHGHGGRDQHHDH
jgi:hypothetical protein